jgi:spore coat polysaccharide biosynthesis predicted glycosyltransferase SpsG/RimJ/RimL family protein N-acetyltransferase
LRVLLRCDSTKAQGLGHVIRTMALAEAALAAGHSVQFSGEVESPVGRALIEDLCSAIHPLPDGPAAVARLACAVGADLVHIDTYADQGDLVGELRRVGVLLSSMEDGSFGRRPADLVIDPSPGAELGYRPGDGSYRLFRGAGAIPIRRSIRELDGDIAASPGLATGRDVMILMGGTDARDMTSRCVELWAQTRIPSRCFVVDPGGRQGFPVELAAGQSLEVVQPSLRVPHLFPSMDLVISGAGTTTWELATLGVPMALVQLVENQADNYAFATGNGMALGLGNASLGQLDQPSAVAALRSLLQDDVRRLRLGVQARSVVDGGGADEIVQYWEQMSAESAGISVRPAEIHDAGQLFDWRNDPTVRQVSREKDELAWDTHVAWVSRVIKDPGICLLIVQCDGQPAGTVRFHVLEDGHWEVSITVAPAMRGQGRASEILSEAERYFLERRPEAVLHASMLDSNVASYKLFLNAGYEGKLDGSGEESWYHLVRRGGTVPGP